MLVCDTLLGYIAHQLTLTALLCYPKLAVGHARKLVCDTLLGYIAHTLTLKSLVNPLPFYIPTVGSMPASP
jgi:hypothetical protein